MCLHQLRSRGCCADTDKGGVSDGSACAIVTTVDKARDMGFQSVVGEASHRDVLEHIHIGQANMVIITIPDPQAARRVIAQVRILAPDAQIISRSRYHIYRWELEMAGAHVVVDEEEQVGAKIAEEVDRYLQSGQWSP